jgi:hypothetical protein
MNYLKVYCNLIRKAENRTPPDGYTEKHHIFPVSIYGKNNRVVVLTSREHYVAHALLEKICIQRYGLNDQKTIKMVYAHTSMKANGNYVNSYLYESARIRRKMLMSGKNNPMYGISRYKYSNPWYGKKHSERTKLMMKERWRLRLENGFVSRSIGRKMSEEQILSMSKEFCVVSPDGEVVRGINQTDFCKKNNLDQGGFNRMVNGKSKTCKGWTLYKPAQEAPKPCVDAV